MIVNGYWLALSKGEFRVLRFATRWLGTNGVANGNRTGSVNVRFLHCARLLFAEAASAPDGSEACGAGSAGRGAGLFDERRGRV